MISHLFFIAWGIFWGYYALRGAIRGKIVYRSRSRPATTYTGFDARLLGSINFLLGLAVASWNIYSIFSPETTARLWSDDRFSLAAIGFLAIIILVFVFADVRHDK
jgi:hypothetical protein